MDEYRNRKREYSNSRDEGSKGRMLDALEDVQQKQGSPYYEKAGNPFCDQKEKEKI